MPVLSRLSMAALVALSVALVSGCGTQYEYPDTVYRPTIVGVVESSGLYGTRWQVTLNDGRTFDLVGDESPPGPSPDPGFLLLGGNTASGEWWLVLRLLGDGCWEAYHYDTMVWDLGSSILFEHGLELPKAAGFWAEVEPSMIDGRLGWLQEVGDGLWSDPTAPTSYCANARGEIEFAVLEWTGQRPSPPPSA
jgi:hypothetical protein